MFLSRGTRIFLRAGTLVTLAFLYLPLLVIALYAFNPRRTQVWPIPGLTLSWFDKAFHNHGARDALLTSVKAGLGAIAIALPGIVTGMALNSTFTQVLHVNLTTFTVIVGHATFCIVVIYNNVVARMRRTSRNIEEASADLGADSWQTFRFVTFPQLRSALVAGALSFDEVIVTTFTAGSTETLPIWILTNLSRPRNLPIVNVVAVAAVILSIIPVYLAQRLTADPMSQTIGAAAQ